MTLPFSKQYFSGTAGLTEGGWMLQAAELRCGMSYCSGTMMLYGGGQWGAPSGEGPLGQGNGGQIYGQYAPPNGPLAIECQLPVYETSVETIFAADFSGSWLVCAGVANALGYGRVWTRSDPTRSWQPTLIWQSPAGTPVDVRSLFSYTDSVTGIPYLFAGSDDGSGNGGIFRSSYNANAPGCLVWNSTPELAISATNQGVTLPQGLGVRVMSFCTGTNARGGTSLFATVGIQVWQRIDGRNPTWQLVWTKPAVNGEVSQSGLRGLTQWGNCLLVFPEGTNWGVVLLNPAESWAATTQYSIANLETALGTGFTVSYVIGAYHNMAGATIESTYFGLIGLGVQVTAYPAGTPVYSPGTGTWLAQSHYLVKDGPSFTLKAMTRQANPTGAVRFMVPYGSTYVMAGGFDFQNFTEAAEYGWGAYDTQANAVSGT